MLGFFSSRPYWDPTLPQPQLVCPPLWFRVGTDSLAREGSRLVLFERGDRYYGNLSKYALCGLDLEERGYGIRCLSWLLEVSFLGGHDLID